MFNHLFASYVEQAEQVTLPLEVTCHREEDAHLFSPRPELDRRTRAFGWSRFVTCCTTLRWFSTADGLDAVLFYDLEQAPQDGYASRGVTLGLFACGQLLDTLQVARSMTHEGAEVPLRATLSARIGRDGQVDLHQVSNWTRARVERRVRYELLGSGRIYRRLERAPVLVGDRVLAFSPPELAQLEARLNEKTMGELDLVLMAAHDKFRELDDPVRRFVAGTLGIPESEVEDRLHQRRE